VLPGVAYSGLGVAASTDGLRKGPLVGTIAVPAFRLSLGSSSLFRRFPRIGAPRCLVRLSFVPCRQQARFVYRNAPGVTRRRPRQALHCCVIRLAPKGTFIGTTAVSTRRFSLAGSSLRNQHKLRLQFFTAPAEGIWGLANTLTVLPPMAFASIGLLRGLGVWRLAFGCLSLALLCAPVARLASAIPTHPACPPPPAPERSPLNNSDGASADHAASRARRPLAHRRAAGAANRGAAARPLACRDSRTRGQRRGGHRPWLVAWAAMGKPGGHLPPQCVT